MEAATFLDDWQFFLDWIPPKKKKIEVYELKQAAIHILLVIHSEGE